VPVVLGDPREELIERPFFRQRLTSSPPSFKPVNRGIPQTKLIGMMVSRAPGCFPFLNPCLHAPSMYYIEDTSRIALYSYLAEDMETA
jgi:hypothetical protein